MQRNLNEIDDFLDYHFHNAQNYFWEKSPNFYIHAWLFIKEVLQNICFDKDNITIIDFIDDDIVKDKIHQIRRRRNEFEHREPDYFTPDVSVFKFDLEALNQFIDYINFSTEMNLKYKFLDQKTKKRKSIFMPPAKEPERKESFRREESIRIKENTKLHYVGGYNSVPVEFSLIIKNLSENFSDSIFAVIHNLLIRSGKIKKSIYLYENILEKDQLDRIFIYEIMILNSARHGFFVENLQVFKVNEKDVDIFKIALNNIMYFYSLLGKMSKNNNRKYTFNVLTEKQIYDASIIAFSVNDNLICAEIQLDEGEKSNNCMWIGERIEYTLTKGNYKYYKQMLNELFGFEDFKEGQVATIKKILNPNGNELMVILPTGYGKSLIYQFLSLIQPCISIVISPSNELIYDQIVNLEELSIHNAGYFYLSKDLIQKYNTIKRIKMEQIQFDKLIYYMTPKDILSEKPLTILRYFERINIIYMITIDECHHMSIWGHKFESEFFTVTKQVIDIMVSPKVLLCSATASEKVREDIRMQFNERALDVIQPVPLDRGYINYKFIKKKDLLSIFKDIKEVLVENYKKNTILDFSNESRIPTLTIIVNNNRDILLKLYSELIKDNDLKKHIILYSGESKLYHQFRTGQKTVLLCSEAFLYGINIPYMRNIFFIGLPPSKEWFYQQTGRVGRKGQESSVVSYSFIEHSDLVSDLINRKISTIDIFSKLAKNYIEADDLSNADFITDNIRDKNKEIELIDFLYSEIENKVYVSSTYEYGRLSGRVSYSEKSFYDFALYILFISGLLFKWVVESDDGSEIRYSFNVNLEFEKGSTFFKKNAIDLINNLSGSYEIRDNYTKQIIDSEDEVAGVLKILVDWFLLNSIVIKRQMFINLWQLAENVSDDLLSNEDIERDLSFHFMGNNYKNELYSNNDDIQLMKLGQNAIKMVDSIAKFCKMSIGDKKDAKLCLNKNDDNFGTSSQVKGAKPKQKLVLKPHNSKKINIRGPKVSIDINQNGDSSANGINPRKGTRFDDGNKKKEKTHEYNKFFMIFEKKIEESDLINDEVLFEIIDYILNKEDIYWIKAVIERKLEDKYHYNYEIILSFIELMNPGYKKYYRFRSVIEKFEEDVLADILNKFNNLLRKENKVIIDKMLLENGHKKHFYRGFLGLFKKIFGI